MQTLVRSPEFTMNAVMMSIFASELDIIAQSAFASFLNDDVSLRREAGSMSVQIITYRRRNKDIGDHTRAKGKVNQVLQFHHR